MQEIQLDKLDGEESTTQVEVKGKSERDTLNAIVNNYINGVKKGEIDNSRASKWSHLVRVTKSLGFTEEGGLVRGSAPAKKDKVTGKEPGRKINKVSMIVGYRFKNISDEVGEPVTIPYITEVFTIDPETGKFKGEVVERELKPGEEVDLTKKYATIFAVIPEISCQFANGTMAKVLFEGKTLEETLNGAYIKLKGEKGIGVHSPEFKEQIGKPVSQQEIDGKSKTIWKVKEKYEPTFGFLNDIEPDVLKAGNSNKSKYGDVRYEAIAHQVREMITRQNSAN